MADQKHIRTLSRIQKTEIFIHGDRIKREYTLKNGKETLKTFHWLFKNKNISIRNTLTATGAAVSYIKENRYAFTHTAYIQSVKTTTQL